MKDNAFFYYLSWLAPSNYFSPGLLCNIFMEIVIKNMELKIKGEV